MNEFRNPICPNNEYLDNFPVRCRFSLKPNLGVVGLVLIGLGGCAFTPAWKASIDAITNAEVNLDTSSRKQQAPSRISGIKAIQSRQDCDDACAIDTNYRLGSVYNEIGKRTEAQSAYAKAMDVCQKADRKTISSYTTICEDATRTHAEASIKANPGSSESIAAVKRLYFANPTVASAPSYIATLRRQGNETEIEKEIAFVQQILVPLERAEQKITNDSIAAFEKYKGTSTASVAFAKANHDQLALYQDALQASAKLGVTQHSDYLARKQSEYQQRAEKSQKYADSDVLAAKMTGRFAELSANAAAGQSPSVASIFGALVGAQASGSANSSGSIGSGSSPAQATPDIVAGPANGSPSYNSETTAAASAADSSSSSSNAVAAALFGAAAKASGNATNSAALRVLSESFAQNGQGSSQSSSPGPGSSGSQLPSSITSENTGSSSSSSTGSNVVASASGSSDSNFSSTTVSGTPDSRGATQSYGGSCPSTLAHLDSRLPRYNHPELQKARQAVLDINMTDEYERQRSSGKSPEHASATMMNMARDAEQRQGTARACVMKTTSPPGAILPQLDNGTYNFTPGLSVMENCAGLYVLAYYEMAAYKEAASLTASCMAKN